MTTTDYRTLARALIEKSERNVLTGYLDQGKVPTWGRGHTGPEVQVGVTITPEHSDLDFTRDIATHDAEMLKRVDATAFSKLTEHEKAALLDFTFNTGGGPLPGDKDFWSIWKDVDDGNTADIPNQFNRFVYVHIDGKAVTSAGLKNRRSAEIVMWNTGDIEAAAAAANAGGNAVSSAATRELPTPPIPDPPKAFSKTSLGLKVGALVASGSAYAGKLVTDPGAVFNGDTQAKAQNVADVAAAHASAFGHFGPALASVAGASVVVIAAGMLLVHVGQTQASKV